jgi:hypothetical protein
MKEEERSRQGGEEDFFFFFFFGVLCGTCRKKVNFFKKKCLGVPNNHVAPPLLQRIRKVFNA